MSFFIYIFRAWRNFILLVIFFAVVLTIDYKFIICLPLYLIAGLVRRGHQPGRPNGSRDEI
jgi:hypothetical protein